MGTLLDRMIVGAAMPEIPLRLENFKDTGTSSFLARRELGLLNVGKPGVVRVEGRAYAIGHLDGLYVGRGSQEVVFESENPNEPAAFYLVSCPAHASHPVTAISRCASQVVVLGDRRHANVRRIYQYIHPGGAQSCQLVMGFTELDDGSVWNTMPPHTHARRSELYLYFDLGEDVVLHLMGEPHATRHLLVRDRGIVLSPPWSIHAGCGTAAYRFAWAMAGENQVFNDMDPVSLRELS